MKPLPIANHKILTFPSEWLLGVFCKLRVPSKHRGGEEETDRAGARELLYICGCQPWELSGIHPPLSSPFSSLVSKSRSLSPSLLPSLPSAEVSSERSRREGGGIHHLFIRPEPRLLNAAWDSAKDNPISQLRFSPATFLWFGYFRDWKVQRAAERRNRFRDRDQLLCTVSAEPFGRGAGKCGELKHNVCREEVISQGAVL